MKHAYRWTALLSLSLLSACGGSSHSSSPAPKTVTIGGSISGLTASGLVLANGTATVSPAANATTFQFPTAVTKGTPYNVSVQTQPTGETCTLTGATGTANATVTSVAVACAPTTYTIGGSVSGLTASGLVLLDNGGDTLAVAANATSFTFPTALGSGIGYDVTVEAGHQPTGETCTVSGGKGTVTSGNVTSVVVTCTATVGVTYTIGGT
ncbi:MAG: Kelch repeat-containing protein, partial [Steroidobacteraceae bacterium]